MELLTGSAAIVAVCLLLSGLRTLLSTWKRGQYRSLLPDRVDAGIGAVMIPTLNNLPDMRCCRGLESGRCGQHLAC